MGACVRVFVWMYGPGLLRMLVPTQTALPQLVIGPCTSTDSLYMDAHLCPFLAPFYLHKILLVAQTPSAVLMCCHKYTCTHKYPPVGGEEVLRFPQCSSSTTNNMKWQPSTQMDACAQTHMHTHTQSKQVRRGASVLAVVVGGPPVSFRLLTLSTVLPAVRPLSPPTHPPTTPLQPEAPL